MVDITDRDRDAFHGVNKTYTSEIKSNGSTMSIVKTFLYMFMYIAITAVVAFGVGALMYYFIAVQESETAIRTYLGVLIASIIALLIDMFVINFVVLRGKHSVVVPGIIYAILIGVIFSTITLFVDWMIIGMAFGVTALAFLIMSGISFIAKGNMRPLSVAILGLFMGVGILALFNWIFMLITGTAFNALYWLVSIGIFVLIMLVTILDLWRMKKIADAGQMTNNLSLYFAFVIYTDFINVFIRVLYFLMIFASKFKK